jgi:hypothetical protein
MGKGETKRKKGEGLRLLTDARDWKVPDGAVVRVMIAGTFCPHCLERGRQRSGYEFEHQWRCGECELVWEPGKAVAVVTW